VKIAFVGKGGSGKSTLTALYIRYLQKMERHSSILAIDADLNMNLAGLLGTQVPSNSFISSPQAADAIRAHLRGNNERIEDVSKFLPTTPPGRGSNIIESANDPALARYAVPVSSRPLVNLLTVGTYEADGVGQSCYHVNLFVAENVLSHSRTSDKFHVVTDMVAGTDAFAYSLHLQFDAINLIVEPTPESVEVCALYLNLARESGVESIVHLIANKVENSNDLEFISKRLGRKPIAVIPVLYALKRGRQLGQTITEKLLEGHILDAMRAVEERAKSPAIPNSVRMTMLHALHKKLNAKKWVQLGYGDLENQIDYDFKMQDETAGVIS
jgi:CO dehydrogenase maturation factor